MKEQGTEVGLDVRAIGVAGAAAIRALARTHRVRRMGEEHAGDLLSAGRGLLFSCWHGQLLNLACTMQHRGVRVLVSEHRDGEIITQIMRRIGFATVRGSTTRGGYRSLVEMIRAGRRGVVLGITPDGPRGPRREVQAGAVLVAQRARIPLLPISGQALPRRRLKSWDRFEIPHPFAKVVVSIGEPIWIPDDLKPEEAIEIWGPRVSGAMEENSARAWRALLDWCGRPEVADD